jgi:hypothetical protein
MQNQQREDQSLESGVAQGSDIRVDLHYDLKSTAEQGNSIPHPSLLRGMIFMKL